MKLTKIEQESIVLFNEAESTAEIYTHNVKLKNKLRRFADKHPGIFLSEDESGGAVTVTMPKNLLTISLRSPMSEAERQTRREHAANNNLFKNRI